jgi:hypothetical protein
MMNSQTPVPESIVVPTSIEETPRPETSDSDGADCAEFIIVRKENVLGVLNGPLRAAKKSG